MCVYVRCDALQMGTSTYTHEENPCRPDLKPT